MATQQNNRGSGGRIYQSKPAETTYQGAARSIGFNPVKAATSEKAMRDYKAAIVADGQTMSRELTRQQQADNLAFEAQQSADKGQLGLDQGVERNSLAASQLLDKSNLKIDQTAATQELTRDHTHQKGIMALEMSHLKAKGQVEAARTKVIGTAIQGLLSFGQSALKYAGQMDALQQKQEAEAAQQAKNDAMNGAFFGDDFISGPTESQVEETNAYGEVVSSGIQAEAVALGDAAQEVRSEGTPTASYEAEQIESLSSWNQLSDVRGNVYAARMQYDGFLKEANAAGLIRPGAQGLQDIQNLNLKFAEATGIMSAAMADPKFVAENFTRQAQTVASNILAQNNSAAAAEIKAAREQKVASNIATNFAGLGEHSSVQDIGAAWDASNLETVNGQYSGRMSGASNLSTTKAVAKELADSGRTAELIKLKQHAPNPNTPNLTLGKQYGDLLDAEILRSRSKARSIYNLGKGELNQQAESVVNSYWDNPSPESLRATEAQLRQINTPASRRLADSLVQHGYEYDPSVARDIASKVGTDQEYSIERIKDLSSKGTINAQETKVALNRAPDTATIKKIDEAVRLYQPGKGLVNNVVARDGGRARPYAPSDASPAFKQELRIKEKRFNIELGRRLRGVLRDNPELDVESQEFQDIVTKESEYLMKQERFQISYKSGEGFSFGEASIKESSADYLERQTIAPGKQTFYNRSATDIFQSAGIPKAMVDPTVDQIMTPAEIKADTEAVLSGGNVSKRTNDWAHALGMSQKDFVNSQRIEKGLPPMDSLKQEDLPQPTYQQMSTNGDIPNKHEGVKALQSLGMPLRGAAYMSSAIQHESTWHGTRQWGEVAGDGTNRNGGLLSWASWAGNSARLGNIERRFGRNIAQISEQEQLQFLMHELKTSYPESHAVFMNPNASSADLQWATWNYIRWDKRYTGNRWTVAESLIRWGQAQGAI